MSVETHADRRMPDMTGLPSPWTSAYVTAVYTPSLRRTYDLGAAE